MLARIAKGPPARARERGEDADGDAGRIRDQGNLRERGVEAKRYMEVETRGGTCEETAREHCARVR